MRRRQIVIGHAGHHGPQRLIARAGRQQQRVHHRRARDRHRRRLVIRRRGAPSEEPDEPAQHDREDPERIELGEGRPTAPGRPSRRRSRRARCKKQAGLGKGTGEADQTGRSPGRPRAPGSSAKAGRAVVSAARDGAPRGVQGSGIGPRSRWARPMPGRFAINRPGDRGFRARRCVFARSPRVWRLRRGLRDARART